MPCKGLGLIQPGEEKASEEPSHTYGRLLRRQGQALKLVDIPIPFYQWRLVWSCSLFEKSLEEGILKKSDIVSASRQCVLILGILTLLLVFDLGNLFCIAWHLACLMTEVPCIALDFWESLIHWQSNRCRETCSAPGFLNRYNRFSPLIANTYGCENKHGCLSFCICLNFLSNSCVMLTYCLKLYKLLLQMVNT